ncbi:DUF397 domain-containing protein [Streptomyces sp. NPDC000594]|uniref:DUF397 domain-containing protein n=1 Tax=Streptomyces sp. NPDC000594 TaxID=3154261 RepID=UPI0033326019
MGAAEEFSGLIWTKSSYSIHSCLELARPDGRSVAVRDSKDPGGRLLRFGADGWSAFRSGIRSGAL